MFKQKLAESQETTLRESTNEKSEILPILSSSNIKDKFYYKFQQSLSVEKIKALSHKLRENEHDGKVKKSHYIAVMNEIFGNEYIFAYRPIFELIFQRFNFIIIDVKTEGEFPYISQVISHDDEIKSYHLCCGLAAMIHKEFIEKLKLIFYLTDIDEDGYVNEKEIKRLIITLNNLFSFEIPSILSDSCILKQSLNSYRIKNIINKIFYHPGNLHELFTTCLNTRLPFEIS